MDNKRAQLLFAVEEQKSLGVVGAFRPYAERSYPSALLYGATGIEQVAYQMCNVYKQLLSNSSDSLADKINSKRRQQEQEQGEGVYTDEFLASFISHPHLDYLVESNEEIQVLSHRLSVFIRQDSSTNSNSNQRQRMVRYLLRAAERSASPGSSFFGSTNTWSQIMSEFHLLKPQQQQQQRPSTTAAAESDSREGTPLFRLMFLMLLTRGRALPTFTMGLLQVNRYYSFRIESDKQRDEIVQFTIDQIFADLEHYMEQILHQELIACTFDGNETGVNWLFGDDATLETEEIEAMAVSNPPHPMYSMILKLTNDMTAKLVTIGEMLNQGNGIVSEDLIIRLCQTYLTIGGFPTTFKRKEALGFIMRLLMSPVVAQRKFVIQQLTSWVSNKGQVFIHSTQDRNLSQVAKESLTRQIAFEQSARLRRLMYELLVNADAMPRPRPGFDTDRDRARWNSLLTYWSQTRLELETSFKTLDHKFTSRGTCRIAPPPSPLSVLSPPITPHCIVCLFIL